MKYIHTENVHNFEAANQVVPELLKIWRPKSVVDVGCGTGTWLKVFIDSGIANVLGVDGEYLDVSQLVIDKKFFLSKNLEEPFVLEEKFDLVLSLEVAEHLELNSADNFIDSLCKLGDFIVFSAAIPNQGGQNHLNEQSPQYWIEKFKNKGYKLYDILRPLFWNNQKVNWWYKQNLMIFSKIDELEENLKLYPNFLGNHLVHPILFDNRSSETKMFGEELVRIQNANKLTSFYFKLFKESLIKKLKN